MQWLWLGLGGLAGDDVAACFFGVPCECTIPRMALSRGCCPGPARAREPDACAAARPRSDAPKGALGVPAAEQVRACGASLHLSLPDRERLPALYLLGPGHTGTSELYAQVVRHPSIISPRTYRGEPRWKAKENSMWKHEFDESRLERAADGAGQLTPALVHDCGVGRQVSCSFVSDQRDWWLRFVPAAQLHVVHNSQLTGGAAAQLVWRVAGLNASSELLAKRNAHNLGANVHSFEAMPPAVQTLISTLLTTQELRDALEGEVQRQAELMLV